MIWVGLRQGVLDKLEVMAASTLKGICEEVGESYNTAKIRDGGTRVVGEWTFVEVELRKVRGRGKGSKGFPRAGGKTG